MAPTARQLGMKLKHLRQARKLSQAALATRAGFTREYVNKIEAGRYDPPLSTLTALAKALRVKVEELVR
jgi:transcriptional regulator with XRE-family HTH domain